MIRAIIIDDEQHCTDRLADLLRKYCTESVQLLGTYDSVEEGLKGVAEHRPDLVLLDVHIGDQTGFDFLEQSAAGNFDVIFTTAYDKYAIRAIKFSALDYLLKPIDPDELQEAVKKFRRRTLPDEATLKFNTLIEMMKNPGSLPKRINVPTMNGLIFLSIADIMRCEAQVNYTLIHTTDGQKIVVAKTLKDFEEMLAGHNFFRVHNSHLINLAYTKSYNKGKGGVVIMTDNKEIDVSTRRRDDFLRQLDAMNR